MSIVMKFGGTSLQGAAEIRNAAAIVQREKSRAPLVVVSACAGVTNQLIRIAESAAQRRIKEALVDFEDLRQRHLSVAAELFSGDALSVVQNQLHAIFHEIEPMIPCVSTLQELTPRTLDQFMACGERCSSLLLAQELQLRGVASSVVDARLVLITDESFGSAIPLFKQIKRQARRLFYPLLRKGEVVVTQGFIGATAQSVTTTLGRGGSDYSAAIFGSVLDVEEIQIWTDVEGILSADPSILPDARSIPEMSFEEAAELAYFGARVLHPSTILPAVRKNIPVQVLNSREPRARGTRITREVPLTGAAVKSIAYKEGINVVRIQSVNMLMAHGFASRVLEVFARHKTSVDLIATSLVGISLTVRGEVPLEQIAAEFGEDVEVTIDRDRAICCVVGEKVKHTRGIASRVFAALDRAGINVEMISHGGSDINLTFVIRQSEVESAVRSLHDEFFEDAKPNRRYA